MSFLSKLFGKGEEPRREPFNMQPTAEMMDKNRYCLNSSESLRIIRLLSVAAVFFLIVSCSSLTAVRVEGNAMLPTYKDGDRVAVNKNAGSIERLDIIIFHYPEDTTKTYIKRVIGLPGETISIADGKVIIDGKELAEPYVDPDHNRSGFQLHAFRVKTDSYFVMGDNRDNSSDSRYWGSVNKELVIGKCF